MGFTWDSPITVDADLTKYAAEWQVSNLPRGAGASLADLHKAAVNAIVRDLMQRGYDPASISNTDVFKAEAVFWILKKIFTAQAREGNIKAQVKAQQYELEWEREIKTRVYPTTTAIRTTRRMPLVGNMDYGMPFGPVTHRGDGNAQWGRTTLPDFDNIVQEDKP